MSLTTEQLRERLAQLEKDEHLKLHAERRQRELYRERNLTTELAEEIAKLLELEKVPELDGPIFELADGTFLSIDDGVASGRLIRFGPCEAVGCFKRAWTFWITEPSALATTSQVKTCGLHEEREPTPLERERGQLERHLQHLSHDADQNQALIHGIGTCILHLAATVEGVRR